MLRLYRSMALPVAAIGFALAFALPLPGLAAGVQDAGARPAGFLAVALSAPAGGEQLETLDEVVVQGRRLFERITALEDRFYGLYNELNANDDFDVHCSTTMLLTQEDSLIDQRACLAGFYIEALAHSGAWEARCRQESPCYEPPPPELVLFARRTEFERHVLEVVNSDPRLKAMVLEREALENEGLSIRERYLSLYAERFAGREGYRSRTRRAP